MCAWPSISRLIVPLRMKKIWSTTWVCIPAGEPSPGGVLMQLTLQLVAPESQSNNGWVTRSSTAVSRAKSTLRKYSTWSLLSGIAGQAHLLRPVLGFDDVNRTHGG